MADLPTLSELFAASGQGNEDARARLFAALYSELRRVAQRELRRGGPSFTLTPTALLHEAYIDVQSQCGLAFPDRAHFFAYTARAMRGLVIDHARERKALKRGAGFEITSLKTSTPDAIVDDVQLGLISDALDELAQLDAPLAELVDLRYFCGFTVAEIAAMRGVSSRRVERDWEKARLLLHRACRPDLTD